MEIARIGKKRGETVVLPLLKNRLISVSKWNIQLSSDSEILFLP